MKDNSVFNPFESMIAQQDELKYVQQPICFKDCEDHYELTYTGEFESVGKDSIAAMQAMQDLRNGDKDIELHIFINSVGGDVENLAMIMQQVLQYKHRVTICCGAALSAGFLLWACGHEKYVSPYGELMYHTIWSCYEGKGTELSSYGKHIENLTQKLITAVDISSLIPDDDVVKGKSTEVWYTGDDFIKSGRAKDYSEYCNRSMPQFVLFTIAGNEIFAKTGENYVKLNVDATKEYTYRDLLEIERENRSTIDIGIPVPDNSNSENDNEKGNKKKQKRKK